MAVWHHHFAFELENTSDAVLELRLLNESASSTRALAAVDLHLTHWASLSPANQPIKCVRVDRTLSSDGERRESAPLDLLLACFWRPCSSSRTEALATNECVSNEPQAANPLRQALSSSHPVPRTLALGSSLRVAIHGICQVPLSILEQLVASASSASDLVVRGRILPGGGSSQVTVAAQTLQVDTAHCAGAASCVQFTDAASGASSIVLHCEFIPSVLDSLQRGTDALRVEIQVRLKRMRDWSLSFCVGLAPLVCSSTTGDDARFSYDTSLMPSQLPILTDDGAQGGVVHVTIDTSDGSSADLAVPSPLMPAQPKPLLDACAGRATVELQIHSLRATDASMSSSCSSVCVKIWTSSRGPQQAIALARAPWNRERKTFEISETSTTRLDVMHRSCDVCFLEVYRFSQHERNELLGRCSFALQSSWGPSTEADWTERQIKIASVSSRVGQSRTMHSSVSSSSSAESPDVWGEILIALRIQNTPSLAAPSVGTLSASLAPQGPKAATSILADAAYTSLDKVESRGVFEVDVVEAYPPSSARLARGNAVSVALRVPTSRWSAQSSFGGVTTVNDALQTQRIAWRENFRAPVSWSPNERSTPVLMLELRVRTNVNRHDSIASKPALVNALPPGSRASLKPLAATSTRKRTGGTAAPAQANESKTSETQDRLLGTCVVGLCAFLQQPSPAATYLLLATFDHVDDSDGEQGGNDKRIESAGDPSAVPSITIPLLVTLRFVSTSQGSTTPLGGPAQSAASSIVPPVKVQGDVCLHVRSATGRFVRRQRGDSSTDGQFVVAASFGKQVARTRYSRRLPSYWMRCSLVDAVGRSY